jgi:hypothetical protein
MFAERQSSDFKIGEIVHWWDGQCKNWLNGYVLAIKPDKITVDTDFGSVDFPPHILEFDDVPF